MIVIVWIWYVSTVLEESMIFVAIAVVAIVPLVVVVMSTIPATTFAVVGVMPLASSILAMPSLLLSGHELC